MCGRYASPDKEAIIMRWPKVHCGCGAEWTPSHNVAPTAQVPIVVLAEDGGEELRAARWGLIPPWWQKSAPPSMTFNARSEDAAQKPTWRDSLRAARCWMPARGWYEWNRNEPALDAAGRGTGQPYFLFRPGKPVLAFAGIWATWQRPGTGTVVSCALLSKKAAPGIARIHPRMPVVLRPESQSRWLDPAIPPDEIQSILADACMDLDAYPVSTRVNNARNDFPELMEKIQPPPASLFRLDE
jgi:putative SOS response-associated peptidase YedK